MTQKVNPSEKRPAEAFKTAGAIAYGGHGSSGFIVESADTTEIAVQDSSISDSSLNAFAETSGGGSLDVTIDPGEAFIFGSWVCIDTSTTVSLASSTNNQTVYVGWDKNATNEVIVGLDSAFSSGGGDTDKKLPLYDYDTDAGGVTGVTDRRQLKQVQEATQFTESVDFDNTINFTNSSAIQDDGTNAIDFDSLGNVTAENNLTVSGTTALNGVTTMGAKLDVSSNDIEDSTQTIWDTLNQEIPDSAMGSIANSTLTNNSVTIEGNTVSLGGSTSVDHSDLSNISSNNHHSKTDSASELTDVSADSNSDAHHSKYTDSDAQSAINSDTDHGSTAAHNYATSASDLSDVSADSDSDAHHSKTTSASDLTDVSADSNSDAHHSKYTDEEAQDAVGSASDSTLSYDDVNDTISVDASNVNHDNLSGGTTSNAHHAKYTDSDAQSAINSDSDHGSTASHNYATSASDLSDVSADSDSDAHHSKTTSASELTDVSADSNSDAHHSQNHDNSDHTTNYLASPVSSSDLDYGDVLANNLSACQGVKLSRLDDGDSVEQPVPVGDTKTLRVYRWGGYNASDGSTPTNLDVELLDGSDTVQKSENTQDTSNASGVVSHQNTSGSTSIFKLRVRNETGSLIPLVGGHFGYEVV